MKKNAKNKLVEEAKKQSAKPDPVVIIKPKANVEIEDAKAEVRNNVNAKNLNVKRVTTDKYGAVVIALGDEKSVNLLKQDVETNLGSQFEVRLRENMKPTIKLIGMDEEFREEELKDVLVDQSDIMGNLKHFKLCKTYSNEKFRYNKHSAIIELDAETFFKVMELGKLNCGLDRCRVVNGLEVTRCFKCCAFNHKVAECKANVTTCPIYSGDHAVKECNSEVERCANCEKLRKERKINIDVNHSAWSTQCPIYIRHLERRNKLVDFST